MSLEKNASYLTYKSVDIYFIFSFVFDFLGTYEKIVGRLVELGWDQGIPHDRQGRPPFLHIKRKGNKPNKYLSTSLSKRLFKMSSKLFYCENDKEYVDKFEVDLEICKRLFYNGAGSITIKVTLKNDVNFRRIYEIHSLSQRLHNKAKSFSKLEWNKNKEGLFNIFCQHITELQSGINEVGSLVELQDREIMDLDANDVNAQNPYVLSVVELDDSVDFTKYFQKASPDTSECKELAAILLRLVYPSDFFNDLRNRLAHVRIPSELLDNSNHIQNYAWDDHVLMWFSKTSSLFAYFDKNRLLADLIKNPFLDILEIIRTRWHMSILINALLDQDMEMIKTDPSSENLNVLETIIKRRKQFASFLHDPLPNSFEGGSITEICKVADREMWLSKLREITFNKFEVLDKLYEDQMRFIRIREFKSFEIDMEAMKTSLSNNLENVTRCDHGTSVELSST